MLHGGVACGGDGDHGSERVVTRPALVADAALLQLTDGARARVDGAVDVAVGLPLADADDQARFPSGVDFVRLSLNTHIMTQPFPGVNGRRSLLRVISVTNGISLAVEDRVKRLILLLVSSFLLPSVAEGSLRLKVDLDERELVAFLDGEELERFTVAVGKKAYPTPTGSFNIRKVIWNPSWRPPDSKWARGKTAKPPGHPDNPMKMVKIFFKEPDYYIHGTAEEHSLGKAASHGCIRMSEDEVSRLGKLVMEYGGKPMPEPWYRRILRSRSSRAVQLSAPVSIVIN